MLCRKDPVHMLGAQSGPECGLLHLRLVMFPRVREVDMARPERFMCVQCKQARPTMCMYIVYCNQTLSELQRCDLCLCLDAMPGPENFFNQTTFVPAGGGGAHVDSEETSG